MKLYIYSNWTGEHIATIIGDGSNDDLHAAAEKAGYNWVDFSSTYSPAFGFSGGLVENPDAQIIYLDN